MHRSRLRAVMIDAPEPDFGPAVAFWTGALAEAQLSRRRSRSDLSLLPGDEGIRVTLQRIDGPARMHVDIETDNVDAEVRRLEALGGQVVDRVEDWAALRDPAGLPVCVIPVDSTDFDETATSWP